MKQRLSLDLKDTLRTIWQMILSPLIPTQKETTSYLLWYKYWHNPHSPFSLADGKIYSHQLIKCVLHRVFETQSIPKGLVQLYSAGSQLWKQYPELEFQAMGVLWIKKQVINNFKNHISCNCTFQKAYLLLFQVSLMPKYDQLSFILTPGYM